MESQKKRRRIALSCDNCRKKKTKCDRNLPCSNCVKLSIGHTCEFSSPDHINHSKSLSQKGSLESNEHNSAIQEELYNLKQKMRLLESTISTSPNQVSPTQSQPSLAQDGITASTLVQPSQLSYDGGLVPSIPTVPGTETLLGDKPSVNIPSLSSIQTTYETDDSIKNRNRDIYVGINPIISDPQFLNLHAHLDSDNIRRPSIPPLPLRCLSRRDPGCSIFWNMKSSPQQLEFFAKIFFNPPGKAENKGIKAIDQRAQRKLGTKHIKQLEDGFSFKEIKASCTAYGQDIGFVYHSIDLERKGLLEKIQAVLPDFKIIDEYLNLFIRTLYVHFPIIDENQVREDLHRIFGSSSLSSVYSGSKRSLQIDKKQDLAIIASTIFILRLTYLSQFRYQKFEAYGSFAGDSTGIAKETKFVLENPIPLDAIDIAEECLKEFNLTQKQDFCVLQAALFSRIYDIHAPDIGDKPASENQATNGILIQLAFFMQLHREPDFVSEMVLTDNQKHLRRKIWHFLVLLDVFDTIVYGTPLTVRFACYDTKLPFYKEGVSNVNDPSLEKEIVKAFEVLRPIPLLLSEFAELLVSIKEKVSLSSIIDSVNDLEILISRLCLRFDDIIKLKGVESDFLVMKRFHHYLHSKMLLGAMYYYLYTYYHDKNVSELEYFYLKKALITMFHELNEVGKVAIFSWDKYFGAEFSFIMSPIINLLNSFSCMISLSLCIRITATIKHGSPRSIPNLEKGNTDHLKIPSQLSELLQLASWCTKDCLSKMSIMSHRYVHAWKTKKAMLYGMKLLFQSPLFDDSSTKKCVANFSSTNLEKVAKVLRNYAGIESPSFNITHPLEVVRSFHLLSLDSTDLQLNENNEDMLISEYQLDSFWRQMRNIKLGTEQDWLRSLKSAQTNIGNGSIVPQFVGNNQLPEPTESVNEYSYFFNEFDFFENSMINASANPYEN